MTTPTLALDAVAKEAAFLLVILRQGRSSTDPSTIADLERELEQALDTLEPALDASGHLAEWRGDDGKLIGTIW